MQAGAVARQYPTASQLCGTGVIIDASLSMHALSVGPHGSQGIPHVWGSQVQEGGDIVKSVRQLPFASQMPGPGLLTQPGAFIVEQQPVPQSWLSQGPGMQVDSAFCGSTQRLNASQKSGSFGSMQPLSPGRQKVHGSPHPPARQGAHDGSHEKVLRSVHVP
jgi:hypothetical protein